MNSGKTQIEIDCIVTLKALGYDVVESSLDHMYRKIYFKTNKKVDAQTDRRITQRVGMQQKETYTVHFDTVKNNNQEQGEN